MSKKDDDAIWKALSDPTRRTILDLLRAQRRTTGELCDAFPDVTRFAVMKHIGVLEAAGLVLTRKEGRARWNYLNPVPIRQIYERWMAPFAERQATAMVRLKEHVERKAKR